MSSNTYEIDERPLKVIQSPYVGEALLVMKTVEQMSVLQCYSMVRDMDALLGVTLSQK